MRWRREGKMKRRDDAAGKKLAIIDGAYIGLE